MSATLRTALAQLAEAATAAGVDPAEARLEGLRLSATVSEPARGAFRDWAAETDEPGGAEAFFDAASQGRRFRSAPTVLMSQLAHGDPAKAKAYADALAGVAAAAVLLGEPHPQVTGNATLAAASQRSSLPAQAQGPMVLPGGQGPAQGATGALPGQAGGAPAAVTPGAFPGLPTGDQVPAQPGVAGGGPSGQPTTPAQGTGEPSWIETMAERGRETADAMGDFTKRAPGILSNVLGQLRHTQDRMAEAGMRPQGDLRPFDVNPFDLSSLDPHAPGAFTGITSTGQPPAPAAGDDDAPGSPTPVVPAAGDPAAAPAPVQTQEDPAAPAEAPKEPEEPTKSVEELLAELDELVGLKSVKEEIHRQSAILRVQALRTKAGLKDPTITRHLIFVGNPGTGKTTIARLVAGIYRALGLLSKGQLVEVDRSELVAGYLGQTAIKTAEICAKAKGGVLFIDEAYSLSGDQYGEEAINTLVKEMEDNRHDLVVIVAGYPKPMQKFIAENPGLSSRFRTTIEFSDYSDDELVGIFTGMAEKADYDVADETVTAFRVLLADQVRDETFGNGRFARNTLEAAIGHQAWRLRDVSEPSLEQLREILPEDLAPTSDEEPVEWTGGPVEAGQSDAGAGGPEQPGAVTTDENQADAVPLDQSQAGGDTASRSGLEADLPSTAPVDPELPGSPETGEPRDQSPFGTGDVRTGAEEQPHGGPRLGGTE